MFSTLCGGTRPQQHPAWTTLDPRPVLSPVCTLLNANTPYPDHLHRSVLSRTPSLHFLSTISFFFVCLSTFTSQLWFSSFWVLFLSSFDVEVNHSFWYFPGLWAAVVNNAFGSTLQTHLSSLYSQCTEEACNDEIVNECLKGQNDCNIDQLLHNFLLKNTHCHSEKLLWRTVRSREMSTAVRKKQCTANTRFKLRLIFFENISTIGLRKF